MRRSVTLILVTLICIGESIDVGAQSHDSYKFESLNAEDGLSHNSVNDICQDDHGFLWIGTMDGINRYDGSRFELFRNISGDSTSLINNTIWTIENGADNDILIGTAAGLCRYSYHTNQFERIPLSIDNNNVSIRSITVDHSKQIWASTVNYGTIRIDNLYNDSSIAVRAYSKNTSNAFLTFVLPDQLDSSQVWVVYPGGLTSINLETQVEKDWNQYIQEYGFTNSIISGIVQDSQSRLWIGTNNKGLFRFDPKRQELKQYVGDDKDGSIGSNNIFDLYIDYEGQLWLTSFGGGLSIMTDMEQGEFINFKKREYDDYALTSNTLTKIIQDRGGRIWMGAHGGGVIFHDEELAPFQLYRSNEDDQLALSSNNITSIYEDSKNHTWIGTREAGVNKVTWSKNGENIKAIQKYNSIEGDPHSLNINTTNSYLESENLGLIIGNRLGGLNVYERGKDRFRDYFVQPGDVDALKSYHVNDMMTSANGDIWMGTSIGIYKWDHHASKLINYNSTQEELEDLNKAYIRFLIEKDGVLWIGASNAGLWKWDLINEKLTIFEQSKPRGEGLNTDNLLCAHIDQNNQLWIGTWEGGLNKMDLSTSKFEYYTEEDGLTNSVIYSIQEDDAGVLWLSTNNGIIRFDPERESFNTFDVKDGLQGEEYNSFAGYKSDRTGRIFFGGMNGLNQFDPKRIRVDTLTPDVYITNLSLHQTDEPHPKSNPNIMNEKEISISSKTYLLEFAFGAPLLSKSDNVKYAYRVRGLSDKWIDLGNKQEFSLTKFSPGTYTLDIRSGLSGGHWSNDVTSLSIYSFPPWWQTWWAYLLYIATITSLLYLYYKNRVSQLLKYQNLRTQISSDLHDDVGTILSSMAFQTEILELEQKPEEKEKYKKITDMSRLALGRMRDTVWAIDARKDNAESLVDRMQDFLFDVMESHEITYEFDKNILSNDLKIAPDIRQSVYLIFKEALTNALKHTNGDHIAIELELNGKGFYLMIKDNGNVDPGSIKKSGLGLSNMKSRADKVGAAFSYQYDDGFIVEMRKD